MLPFVYEYHVIEQSFRRRLVYTDRAKFERSIFYEFFSRDTTVGALKRPRPLKG